MLLKDLGVETKKFEIAMRIYAEWWSHRLKRMHFERIVLEQIVGPPDQRSLNERRQIRIYGPYILALHVRGTHVAHIFVSHLLEQSVTLSATFGAVGKFVSYFWYNE